MQEAVIDVPPTFAPLTFALTLALADAEATAGSEELQVSGMSLKVLSSTSTTVASMVLEVPLGALMMVSPVVLTAREIDFTGHVVKFTGLLLLFPTEAKI
jgi:hypothetical protein